jgi:hypothetical protein
VDRVEELDVSRIDDARVEVRLIARLPIEETSAHRRRMPAQLRLVGTVIVEFAGSASDAPVAMHVELTDGITPAKLQRLPWARVVRAADASQRIHHATTPSAYRDAFQEMASAARGSPRRRPGRPSKGMEFYAEIAAEYLDLAQQGFNDPVKRIADRRGSSRNTVAGWVRKARGFGLLPPARRGRTG